MDGTGDSHEELDTAEKMKPEASKKRKAIQKAAAAAAVVTVMKVVESTSSACVKQKSEGPPLDSWSWRKYGQKPIKGSPFPRGYYRCSSSKGCSAKKQVERCKTDSDMIIITYTSDHNHPCPQPQQHHLSSITPKKEYQDPQQQQQLLSEDQTFITSSTTDEDEEHQQEQQEEEAHIFHYLYSQSPPLKSSLEYQDPFCQHLLVADDFDGEQLHDHHHHLSLQSSHDQLLLPLPITLTSHQDQDQDQEENDGFFNDLEELPIFTRTSLFHHDRILVHPPS